jgi:hypothetical protein
MDNNIDNRTVNNIDNDDMDNRTYAQKYYLAHKEELNHARLRNYYKQHKNIPTEFFESYIANKKLYGLLKKEKNTINKKLVLFILEN